MNIYDCYWRGWHVVEARASTSVYDAVWSVYCRDCGHILSTGQTPALPGQAPVFDGSEVPDA